jgi:PIN domain nuclease of toxin-antitoxin system
VNLLLDTHLLIWAAEEADRLPGEAADLILDPDNSLHFSAASIWEIAIKAALRRPDFTTNAAVLRRGLLDNDYAEVPISGVHAAAVARLPILHKDPFDRLLVAQAMEEGLLLLTADAEVAAYGPPVRLIRR